ncbi:MAG: DNA polymerase III subunit delta [Egibacteraceae bacterium]
MPAHPPMYLLTGPEELLLRRAAERILDALRGDGDLEVVDVRAAELPDGRLPDLRTASLFGTRRAVLLRGAQELPAPVRAALQAELDGPPLETTVLLLATATGPIVGLAKRIKALGGRIDVVPPRDWEEAAWARLVADEFRAHGRTPDRGAVQAILGHAGLDVSAVAEKVAQVAVTAPGGTVTAAHVESVVVGHGSRGSFAVADAMCERDVARALQLLRGVLSSGDHPVMVLGALAYRLRSIVAVAARLDVKSVGLSISPGQARRLAALRRNFGPGELTRAYRILATADVGLKSGDLPGELVLERAVLEIATPSP